MRWLSLIAGLVAVLPATAVSARQIVFEDAVGIAEAVMLEDFDEFITLDPDDKVLVADILRETVGDDEFARLRELYVEQMMVEAAETQWETSEAQPDDDSFGMDAVGMPIDGPDANGSPSDWPRSMSDFKYPFAGYYNDWFHGQVWKIICGYGCGKHRNECLPHAAKESIDLARDDGGQTMGSYVLAPARGRVIFAGWQNGYGWCVEMDHGNGYRSIVAHLACDPNIFTAVGHDLLQGTLIGIAGMSGSYTPHIHFSVWQNGCSVPLGGISGGGAVVEGGRYCSGNAYVTAPKGRTSCP